MFILVTVFILGCTVAACSTTTLASCPAPSSTPVFISHKVPHTASQVIPEAFISFAIEFSHFPDFAGNTAAPNVFSDNLLNNIGNFTGTKPYIRGSKIPHGIIHIGPSFFQSYGTWPNTKFSHGFDLGQIVNASGWQTLLDTVPLACAALEGKLVAWEYGNEPDLYILNGLRKTGWNNVEYVSQWQNGTAQIQRSLAQACPAMATGGAYGYIGLSFLAIHLALNPRVVWEDLKTNGNIKMVSFHNYMASTNDSSVTLENTLLNHTFTTESFGAHLTGYQSVINDGAPIIVGEANSLFNTGTPGISNTFGAALWTMDYNLWCASQNISRVHMQQGLNFVYNAWQPTDTPAAAKGTLAPYYGSIAAAAMLNNATNSKVQIASIPMLGDAEVDVAYAAYVGGSLARIAVLNLRAYDADSGPRPARNYSFSIPGLSSGSAVVRRLQAPGSDALTGITWDGYSYDYSLGGGMPVLLPNVTRGHKIELCSGVVSVLLGDAAALILDFKA